MVLTETLVQTPRLPSEIVVTMEVALRSQQLIGRILTLLELNTLNMSFN